MRAVFYPGCTFKTSAGYLESYEEINKLLNIELPELDDWNCCGATALFSVDELLSLVFPARNIAKAEKLNFDTILTPCNACYATLRKAKYILATDGNLRSKVQSVLEEEDLKYRGNIRIMHLLDYYLTDEILGRIKEKKTRDLSHIKVACYYGCQYTRPVVGEETDHPEFPSNLDRLALQLGVRVVDFTAKTYCCGASMMVIHKKECTNLMRKIIMDAKNKGADLIVSICPLCQFNLEIAMDDLGESIPVIFFTQLIGLALGIGGDRLGFDKLLVPVEKVLTKIGY